MIIPSKNALILEEFKKWCEAHKEPDGSQFLPDITTFLIFLKSTREGKNFVYAMSIFHQKQADLNVHERLVDRFLEQET